MKRVIAWAGLLFALLVGIADAQFGPRFTQPPRNVGTIAQAAQQRAPYILAKSAIPFIHISSGTMGDNGALSAVTTLPTTYSNGAYVWLPAASIAAGVPAAATWYWCVFSSTTAATCFNSTYTSGPVTAGTATAFATTGPGAFLGDTTEAAGPTITIPAGAMGTTGSLRITTDSEFNNTAGVKTFRVRFSGASGTQCQSHAASTQVSARSSVLIHNRSASSQLCGYTVFLANATSQTVNGTIPSANTAAATTVVFSLQKATATDNLILDSHLIELISDGT